MTQPCSQSPTLAHYWLLDNTSLGRCKYCNSIRQFDHSPTWYADYASKGAKVRMTKAHSKELAAARAYIEQQVKELEE